MDGTMTDIIAEEQDETSAFGLAEVGVDAGTKTQGDTDSKIVVDIDRTILAKALTHVQSVVEKRTTIPILSHIKLEAENDVLRLTATDMDIAIVEEVEAKVTTKGALTVPAHMLYDIVRKLPDGAVINLDGEAGSLGKLFIKAANCNFTLPCLEAKDFPSMDKGELTSHFTLSAKDCITLVEKPRFAISTEETRYYLNGIYLHTVEEEGQKLLRTVATDGHRLARVQVPAPKGAEDIPSVIVPRKTVLELKKLIEQGVEDINVSLSKNKIRFVCRNAVLLSKLIDGTYPDYEKVIPQGNDKLLEIEVETLREAVDRVSIVASDKLRAIKFTLEPNSLTLSADGSDTGAASEVIEVDYNQEVIEIGFNSRYLLEMLSQIDGSVVQVKLANNVAPAIVRDTGDAASLYVIMPMRV